MFQRRGHLLELSGPAGVVFVHQVAHGFGCVDHIICAPIDQCVEILGDAVHEVDLYARGYCFLKFGDLGAAQLAQRGRAEILDVGHRVFPVAGAGSSGHGRNTNQTRFGLGVSGSKKKQQQYCTEEKLKQHVSPMRQKKRDIYVVSVCLHPKKHASCYTGNENGVESV
ncbi:hypothetical protein OAN24_04890 [Pseudodesulfovibrio sp.]|nr:hypothetical protein [Pseudodesulfovibrio sp.]